VRVVIHISTLGIIIFTKNKKIDFIVPCSEIYPASSYTYFNFSLVRIKETISTFLLKKKT